MALAPRDIPITREMIRRWISSWKISQSQGGTATLHDFIASKIDALGLLDDQVNTSGMDHVPLDAMAVADYIMLDIPSYDNAPSS